MQKEGAFCVHLPGIAAGLKRNLFDVAVSQLEHDGCQVLELRFQQALSARFGHWIQENVNHGTGFLVFFFSWRGAWLGGEAKCLTFDGL